MPRVTIAVPVYNGATFVAECMRSILRQTYADFEVIITDNASTDRTEAICRSFAKDDPRITYHRLPENIGAGPNFNRGFELARGEYFKWCAHDDLISPTFIERCVEALDARPDASLAFARTQCIDANGDFIPWRDDGFTPSIESDDPVERFGQAMATAGTCFPIFGLFRTEALKRSSLHRPYYGSDRALIAETALLGKVVQVEEDAVFYNREHGTRSINLTDPAERSRWQNASVVRRRSMQHINLLMHLIEISCRHRDVASAPRALAKVARLAFTPRQLGRYALDLARYVMPSGGARLKQPFVRQARPDA